VGLGRFLIHVILPRIGSACRQRDLAPRRPRSPSRVDPLSNAVCSRYGARWAAVPLSPCFRDTLRREQHKRGTLRIGNDREAADLRDVGGCAVDSAASLPHAIGHRTDILDPDVAEPAGSSTSGASLSRQRH
jgi:hypothetical protein